MARRLLTAPVLSTSILLLQLLVSYSSPYAISGKAKSQLSQLIRTTDVHKDIFTLLQEPQRVAWRGDGGRNISDFKASFNNVPATLLVEVKLVGFDGSTAPENINIPSDYLHQHFAALQKDLESVVMQPEFKHLVVKPTIEFQISHGSRQLYDEVNRQLANAVQAERARNGRFPHEEMQLNYKYVDRCIFEDAQASRGAGLAAGLEGVAALTVYLLNPRTPVEKGEEYLYSYEEFGDQKPSHAQSCPGTLYVSSTQPAYVWIDIRAGPTSYGPGAGHRGQVLPHSMPHPIHYKAHMVQHALVPDLAALVWSACQHMLWPPVLHTAISPKPAVSIQVVHMHDTLAPPPDRLDQDAIGALLRGALGGMQEVQVKEIWLPFAHCDLCVAAYASATKVRTARADGSVYMQAKTSKMLDRFTLHQILQEHSDGILTGFPGVSDHHESHMEEGMSATRHVIPVFVFDVSESGEEGLLIDGTVKATAFSDMVIAVSSRARLAPTHFNCRWQRCEPVAGNVTREVLAALLSSGWGVPDTATYYSAGAGEGDDYRWNVGNTPFGPLSHRLSVNAAQAQAARRNLVIMQLEASVARITRLLEAFSKLSKSGKLDQQTTRGKRDLVLQRLNIAHFKLGEAARLLAQWQAADAYTMARSMQHDVVALERAARAISAKLEGKVVCEGATTVWSVWWAPVGAVLMWPLAFWVRARLSRRQSIKFDKIY